MIPIRKPLEAIGAEVGYDSINRVVTAFKDNVSIIVNCKNFLYKVASQKCTLLQVHFVQCCKL